MPASSPWSASLRKGRAQTDASLSTMSVESAFECGSEAYRCRVIGGSATWPQDFYPTEGKNCNCEQGKHIYDIGEDRSKGERNKSAQELFVNIGPGKDSERISAPSDLVLQRSPDPRQRGRRGYPLA